MKGPPKKHRNWRLRWNVYACGQSTERDLAGDGPGVGEIKLCSFYSDSSTMSSKMHKSRYLRKFSGMMQN